jgi:hypothetical protein
MIATTKPSHKTPKTIWLLLGEGDEGSHVWCDDPDPSGNGETESVEYIRADAAKRRNVIPEALVVDLARELYDRFVMGGWEPEDAHDLIRDMLTSAPPPPTK